MKEIIPVWLLTAEILLVLSGCSTVSGSISVKDAVMSNQLPCVGATKLEVIDKFGKPIISNSNYPNLWEYRYSKDHQRIAPPPTIASLIFTGILGWLGESILPTFFVGDAWVIYIRFDENFQVKHVTTWHERNWYCRGGILRNPAKGYKTIRIDDVPVQNKQ